MLTCIESMGNFVRQILHAYCFEQVYANLDEKLLQEFPAYLEERGIDADMGNYLLALVNDKEEREYKSWLEHVQKFLKK